MEKMEQPCTLNLMHKFDKKYKTVVRCKSTPEYMSMLEWVNSNSYGAVDVWFHDAPVIMIDVAFENIDDALVFKIKYSV
jgi:hypothetical protein